MKQYDAANLPPPYWTFDKTFVATVVILWGATGLGMVVYAAARSFINWDWPIYPLWALGVWLFGGGGFWYAMKSLHIRLSGREHRAAIDALKAAENGGA